WGGGGDGDRVAVNVVIVDDDAAEIDPYAPIDAGIRRVAGVALGYPALPFDRAAHRIDDAVEFGEQPVAGGVDDAAVVLGDRWVDQPGAYRFEAPHRAFLIGADQPRIARHIGREDRRAPPFDASVPCRLHGASSVTDDPTRNRGRAALSMQPPSVRHLRAQIEA